MARKKQTKTLFNMFHHSTLAFPIPQREVARIEIMTRVKRRHPKGYVEAVRNLEAEVAAVFGDQGLTAESWAKAKPIGKGRVMAAMGILLTFGVSHFPVPEAEEAAARALANPVEKALDAA